MKSLIVNSRAEEYNYMTVIIENINDIDMHRKYMHICLLYSKINSAAVGCGDYTAWLLPHHFRNNAYLFCDTPRRAHLYTAMRWSLPEISPGESEMATPASFA